MKLVLGCDNYIYRCDGAFYAKASDKAFYDRYLRVFDTLRIVARTRTASAEEVARYVRLDDARTEVWPVYFFRGPKQYLPKALRVRRDMRGAADGCGACIVRLPSITGSNLLAEVRRKGIPYAVEIVDDAHDEMTGTRNPLYKAIWLLIHHDLLRACRHAAGIACVTESYLQQRYGNPDPACFKSHYSSIALDHAFYAAPRERRHGEEFAICHVAHPIAGRRKGQEELIRAARIVADRGYAVRLRFAGEGPMVPVFEELARELGVSDRVEFVGFLDRRGLRRLLDESDAMVFPTHAEGLPRVVIEAMATGLPIISTRVSGIPELLEPDMMLTPGDTQGLARRIVALIDDDELYRRASAHNFRNSLKYESTLLQARRDEFYRRLRSRAEK
ncbi:MAG: glycosyltransferase family 4 protein [Alistipes sp.]|jgi:glycosyltransferase, family 1|uniref:glycosyltransferase family 4 protein n=1 Tax=Alistipes sp. TaxID=1872444 RepID=UPI0011CA5A5C|nr:glycosyltransferase family 4 protein [Alistipes sp.]MBS6100293.1 glycosyltransferase family 4 protein [Alistipes sp.]HJI18679.1 glycosyltransferase family 4 protein [Rikenellaceae bacterium]